MKAKINKILVNGDKRCSHDFVYDYDENSEFCGLICTRCNGLVNDIDLLSINNAPKSLSSAVHHQMFAMQECKPKTIFVPVPIYLEGGILK